MCCQVWVPHDLESIWNLLSIALLSIVFLLFPMSVIYHCLKLYSIEYMLELDFWFSPLGGLEKKKSMLYTHELLPFWLSIKAGPCGLRSKKV